MGWGKACPMSAPSDRICLSKSVVIGLSGWLEAALSRGLILSAAKKEDARTFFHSTSSYTFQPGPVQQYSGQIEEAGAPHSAQVIHCGRVLRGAADVQQQCRGRVELCRSSMQVVRCVRIDTAALLMRIIWNDKT